MGQRGVDTRIRRGGPKTRTTSTERSKYSYSVTCVPTLNGNTLRGKLARLCGAERKRETKLLIRGGSGARSSNRVPGPIVNTHDA